MGEADRYTTALLRARYYREKNDDGGAKKPR
jgi:hypothetical protein